MTSYLIGTEQRSYDQFLINNLDGLKKSVYDDWDGIIFIFGREGSGKSTLAMQIGAYLDPNFSLDKVCWTPQQFKNTVLAAKKYDCIVLDEAYMSFASENRFKEFQTELLAMLTQIRKKNLFILIVCPTFFGIRPYIVLHRSLAAIKVYAKDGKRGYWAIFGEEKKRELYIKGRKDQNVNCGVTYDLHGHFGRWFPLDKEEYERRKDAAIDSMRDTTKEEVSDLQRKKVEAKLIADMKQEDFWTDRIKEWYVAREKITISSYNRRLATALKQNSTHAHGALSIISTPKSEPAEPGDEEDGEE